MPKSEPHTDSLKGGQRPDFPTLYLTESAFVPTHEQEFRMLDHHEYSGKCPEKIGPHHERRLVQAN